MIDREASAIFDRRSALFLGGGAVLSAILVARMLQLQLFQHSKYKRLSERNSEKTQINLAKRGAILDANGVPLAKDVPTYRIYIIPEEAEDPDALLSLLGAELNLKPADMERIRKKIGMQRGFQATLIRESTDWNKLAGLLIMNIPGLHIERGYSRHYPSGRAGAQTIGYVGALHGPAPNGSEDAAKSPFFTLGQTGLEKVFDGALAGRAGKTILNVDAVGRIALEDKSKEVHAIEGRNVQTTIIEPVQRKLHELLEPHKSGCGVVMNTAGEILAMASAPSFDANDFRGDNGPEVMRSLNADMLKPFMNKPVEGMYPPGSTFKIIVALAALESGAIKPGEKIFCPGHWEYGRHLYHCWEKHGHGWMDLAGALQHSCDVYFYQVALRVGIDAVHDMARRLGLGAPVMNLLPREAAGIIPDKAWKEKHTGQRWQHGDTIISGIGQGFVLASCLQLAVMLGRAATNKIITPRMTANPAGQGADEFPALGLKEKNIRLVMGGLEKVMQDGGTASFAAVNVRGARMAGKTGTSQVRSISMKERQEGVRTNEQLPWELRNHGLFVGCAPLGNPKYIVSALIEHSGSSGPAARVAADIMKVLLRREAP